MLRAGVRRLNAVDAVGPPDDLPFVGEQYAGNGHDDNDNGCEDGNDEMKPE
jgi:hypothetical protein